MAQSITRSQAELLASNFLDSIGSNPEYSDIELDESLIALIQLAGELILDATQNLEKRGNVSSGALISSFKVRDPQMEAGAVQLDIEALDYYDFLNKGVKGTKGGSGKYAFKSAYPSDKMVKAIAAWIGRAGLSTFNVKKSVSKLEKKNKSISKIDRAYAVARSIKMKGIKKTGYLDKAINATKKKAVERLGKALTADVVRSLPTTLDNGTGN